MPLPLRGPCADTFLALSLLRNQQTVVFMHAEVTFIQVILSVEALKKSKNN